MCGKIKTVMKKGLLAICTMILVVITTFALVQVCGRYLFRHTFFWVEEVTAILLGWMVACGVPLVWLNGDHISMDAIDSFLSDRMKRIWDVVIQLLGILYGGVCLYSGLRAVRQNTGYSISMLRYDESLRFWWIPAMGAMLIVSACLVLYENSKKRREEHG